MGYTRTVRYRLSEASLLGGGNLGQRKPGNETNHGVY